MPPRHGKQPRRHCRRLGFAQRRLPAVARGGDETGEVAQWQDLDTPVWLLEPRGRQFFGPAVHTFTLILTHFSGNAFGLTYSLRHSLHGALEFSCTSTTERILGVFCLMLNQFVLVW